MVNISIYMDAFINELIATFGERVFFVGLQGSYARGEANENSDIDVVVILEEFTVSDIYTYDNMLDAIPDRKKICGFISGKKEILNWEVSELFQFYYDTKPLIGNLDVLLQLIDESAVLRAIKSGVCNIYHGCVHNMLHTKSEKKLFGLYKSASFVIQAICFKETEKYVSHLRELLKVLDDDECRIIETFIELKNGRSIQFKIMSETLFNWSVKMIGKYS